VLGDNEADGEMDELTLDEGDLLEDGETEVDGETEDDGDRL
jgi:hypothetical protein